MGYVGVARYQKKRRKQGDRSHFDQILGLDFYQEVLKYLVFNKPLGADQGQMRFGILGMK